MTKDLTEKVHGLQTAVVALQIREKVGVMKQRAVQVDGDPTAAITLLTDSCSVLDVYPYAPDVLRKDYINALDTAFSSLCKACVTEGKQMRAELASVIVRQAKSPCLIRESATYPFH